MAEEVGVECKDINAINVSSSWPIPEGSLLCAFEASADSSQKVICLICDLEWK